MKYSSTNPPKSPDGFQRKSGTEIVAEEMPRWLCANVAFQINIRVQQGFGLRGL